MRARRQALPVAVLALLVAGGSCTRGDGGGEATAPAPEQKPARRLVDPSATGLVRGTVRTTVVAEAGAVEAMAGVAGCRALHAAPVPAQGLRAQDGRLADAFVQASGLGGWEFPPASGEVVLDQVGCLFEPRTLGARTGQVVAFMNSDPLLHNVQLAPTRGRRINVAMPRPGMRKTVTFAHAEGPIPVRCDVHPWMRASIFVLDHPCFDVTDAAGEFVLEGVPAGEITVEAWHERLGRASARVTVVAGQESSVELVLPAGP